MREMKYNPHLFLIVLCLALISGCHPRVYKGYEGPAIADKELAIIKTNHNLHLIEQDSRVIYNKDIDGTADEIRLNPGEYKISSSRKIWETDRLATREGFIKRTDLVDLKGGHVYEVIFEDHYFFLAKEHQYFLWIEDRTTGEVVAGEKEDLPEKKDRDEKWFLFFEPKKETFVINDTSPSTSLKPAIILNMIGWRLRGCHYCIRRISRTDESIVYDLDRDGIVKCFEISPGNYIIEYRERMPTRPDSLTNRVLLKEGRVYQARQEWIYPAGWVPWIEDTMTGEVIGEHE